MKARSGFFKQGSGQAHNCCKPHEEVFHCKMHGTFNIRVPFLRITEIKPHIVHNGKQYWLVLVRSANDMATEYVGWAIRDKSSNQLPNVLEVLTRRRLPDCLRDGELKVLIPDKWSDEKVTRWALRQYWFQTFDFSPKPRANSRLVWEKINVINWSNQLVYDAGCHYGFFSFEASKRGACVYGFDKDDKSLGAARTIRDHIVQQDVRFIKRSNSMFGPKCCDVMLYLSVHHQVDPAYAELERTLERLKQAVRKTLFIELILPPTFPTGFRLTERDIDDIIDGETLHRYKHAVRGTRKIYRWEAKS